MPSPATRSLCSEHPSNAPPTWGQAERVGIGLFLAGKEGREEEGREEGGGEKGAGLPTWEETPLMFPRREAEGQAFPVMPRLRPRVCLPDAHPPPPCYAVLQP